MNKIAIHARSMPFAEAAELWRVSRKPYLNEKTFALYAHYIKALNRFFGAMILQDIHAGHLREYQRMRSEGQLGRTCGPSIVNHELNTLSQVLARAGLWEELAKHYEPLPMLRWQPPRVLTEDEEDRLFRIAASNPNWQVAYWAASLANNTSAHGKELRMLRLRDVYLDDDPPKIHIPQSGAKNEYRARVIPLNEIALKQVMRLMERAKVVGSVSPDHFLFPFRIHRNSYDPTRPASSNFIRTSFNGMKAAADLNWITPRCMRFQVITKMLEFGAPEQTVMSIAGHVSRQMMNHYSRTRIQAKAEVLSAILSRARAK